MKMRWTMYHGSDWLESVKSDRTQSIAQLTWFKQAMSLLNHLFLQGADEPYIREYLDRTGQVRWYVRDSARNQSAHLTSENDVRVWFEQRYHRSSIASTEICPWYLR